MLLFLALLLPLQDGDFGAILKRFEADEPALRERASKDLDAFVRKLGPGALEFLKEKLAGSQGEARGRLQDQINRLERIDKVRKILQPLEEIGLPDLSRKRLVYYTTCTIYNQGSEPTFQFALGWLLEETKEKVRLLSLDLHSTDYDRKFDPPRNWEEIRKKLPKHVALPGEMVDVDFSEACARVCDPTPVDAQRDPYGWHLGPAAAWSIHAPVLAAVALQRGDEKRTAELLEAHEAVFRRDRRDEKKPYPEILAGLVCGHLRGSAIVSAEPRPAILKQWQTMHRLQPGYREGEAGKMIRLYEKLIEQDQAWKEPGPGEDGKKNAEYWIHHLRDVAARQSSDPGSCDILHRWDKSEKGESYPPDELIKLGWDAVPALIDHLDDPLPTRSVGWHRSFNVDSYYLLRIGDCCEQIFTAITGVDIYRRASTSGAMVKDGEADASKAKAQKWWSEHGKSGAEGYYLGALKDPDRAEFAAEKLVAMDQAKHFPKLIELLEKGTPPLQRAVLVPLGPFLQKEHEKLLDPLLTNPDPQAIVSVTRILWDRFKSDRGALELIRRLGQVAAEDQDSGLVWHSSWTLRPIRTEAVARGLIELMKAKHTRVRMDAYQTAAEYPHPLMAKALVEQLEDKTLTGWSSTFPIRFCDQAAGGLIRMAGLGERFDLKGSEEERDRTIAGLKAWWQKDGATTDWPALLKKVEASERPKKQPKD